MFSRLTKLLTPIVKSLTNTTNCALSFYSPRSHCIPITEIEPKCHPMNVKCQKKVSKRKSKYSPFANLIPKCPCTAECKDALPRFDDIYYKMSDKRKRNYTQTWVDCPMIYRKKCLNCYKAKRPPPYKKRVPGRKIMGIACEKSKSDLMNCKNLLACPKIKLPCCKPVRDPPKCFDPPPEFSMCFKICPPGKSFSELNCPRNKKRKRECDCYEFIPQCAIYELIRKGLLKNPEAKI